MIKQAFSEKSQTEIENQTQTKSQTENHEVSDLVCVLQATIDTLQGQLEVKDRQIEQQAQTITRLTDALAAAQQTAVAAQAPSRWYHSTAARCWRGRRASTGTRNSTA